MKCRNDLKCLTTCCDEFCFRCGGFLLKQAELDANAVLSPHLNGRLFFVVVVALKSEFKMNITWKDGWVLPFSDSVIVGTVCWHGGVLQSGDDMWVQGEKLSTSDQS